MTYSTRTFVIKSHIDFAEQLNKICVDGVVYVETLESKSRNNPRGGKSSKDVTILVKQ